MTEYIEIKIKRKILRPLFQKWVNKTNSMQGNLETGKVDSNITINAEFLDHYTIKVYPVAQNLKNAFENATENENKAFCRLISMALKSERIREPDREIKAV